MAEVDAAPLITSTPELSDPMTWDEICQRDPDEWVCLVEIDRISPNHFDFRTARVVGHGKTRREPLVQARAWRSRYPSIGHYSTGSLDFTMSQQYL